MSLKVRKLGDYGWAVYKDSKVEFTVNGLTDLVDNLRNIGLEDKAINSMIDEANLFANKWYMGIDLESDGVYPDEPTYVDWIYEYEKFNDKFGYKDWRELRLALAKTDYSKLSDIEKQAYGKWEVYEIEEKTATACFGCVKSMAKVVSLGNMQKVISSIPKEYHSLPVTLDLDRDYTWSEVERIFVVSKGDLELNECSFFMYEGCQVIIEGGA